MTTVLHDAAADEVASDWNDAQKNQPIPIEAEWANRKREPIETFANVLFHIERRIDGSEGRGDYIVIEAAVGEVRWRLTDGLRKEIADAAPSKRSRLGDDAKHGAMTIRTEDLHDAIRQDDIAWNAKLENGVARYRQQNTGIAPPIAEALVDMPGQKKDEAGRLVVPIWVTRDDVKAACGKGGDKTYGAALNRFCDAARQPLHDASFKKTGEVSTGAVGLIALDQGFGKAKHRRLLLDVAKLSSIAHSAPNGAKSLMDLVQGSHERQRSVDETTRASRAAKRGVAAKAKTIGKRQSNGR